MSGLSRGVFALARTKRKRWLWCAWWTGEPTVKPFRPPDAWGGGARTEDEARVLAERAAGMPLELVDGHWAGAWKRLLAGRPPFPPEGPREPGAAAPPKDDARPRPLDPHALLDVAHSASLDELKAAFRKKALEHHPDHGGSAASFMAVKRAYDALVKRRARRPGR
jgi:hypothetical protein